MSLGFVCCFCLLPLLKSRLHSQGLAGNGCLGFAHSVAPLGQGWAHAQLVFIDSTKGRYVWRQPIQVKFPLVRSCVTLGWDITSLSLTLHFYKVDHPWGPTSVMSMEPRQWPARRHASVTGRQTAEGQVQSEILWSMLASRVGEPWV